MTSKKLKKSIAESMKESSNLQIDPDTIITLHSNNPGIYAAHIKNTTILCYVAFGGGRWIKTIRWDE